MHGEKSRKIVGDDTGWFDTRIKAPFASARSQDVPERGALFFQQLQPPRIWKRARNPQHGLEKRPKGISRVRIVLGRFKRRSSGHAAEDADHGIRSGDRKKTRHKRHGKIILS
jgi:hypothetical protein